MIEAIARTLQVSNGEAVQLVASSLSAIGGLAAAFAAWKAARLSAHSVSEMRETRRQSVRPAFQLQGGRRIRATLSRSSIELAEDCIGGDPLSSDRKYACFRAANIGLGIARDLEAYFSWDGPPLRDVQLRRVVDFLGRNDIEIAQQGRLEEGRLYGPFTLGYIRTDVQASCAPGDAFEIQITHWDLQALLMKTLAHALGPSSPDVFSECGDLTIEYVSLAGEKQSQAFRISTTGYVLPRKNELAGAWSEAKAYLSISIVGPTGLYPQPLTSFRRLLWLARGRRVSKDLSSDRRKWAKLHRTWLRRRTRRRPRGN